MGKGVDMHVNSKDRVGTGAMGSHISKDGETQEETEKSGPPLVVKILGRKVNPGAVWKMDWKQ